MRSIVRSLLALVILLAAAWLGLRWYAEAQMQAGINAWNDRMTANGDIKVSYDSITRGASPLTASVILHNVQYVVQANPAEAPVSITLPTLALRIEADEPLVLHLDLPRQINISTPRGDGALTFGSVAVAEQLDLQALTAHEPDPFKSATMSASDINLLASSGSLLILHADSYSAQGTLDRTAGAGETALRNDASLQGIALSPLLTRLASIPFGGRITQLGVHLDISGPLPANWQAALAQFNAVPATDKADRSKIALGLVHEWAAARGSANGSLILTVGPSTLKAGGNVKFDANAQASGTANVSANHLDAFSAAITNAYPQMQGPVNQIEARLSPYLSSSDAEGQMLNMHIAYGSGTVTVNGAKVSDLPPIDWNNLLNPPAQAPGDGSGAAIQ